MGRCAVLSQLQQAGQRQRLDQHLVVRGAVSGVVDELEDVFFGQAVGGRAHGRISDLPREGEFGRALAEQFADREYRRCGEELAEDLELRRGEVVPSTRWGDSGER